MLPSIMVDLVLYSLSNITYCNVLVYYFRNKNLNHSERWDPSLNATSQEAYRMVESFKLKPHIQRRCWAFYYLPACSSGSLWGSKVICWSNQLWEYWLLEARNLKRGKLHSRKRYISTCEAYIRHERLAMSLCLPSEAR